MAHIHKVDVSKSSSGTIFQKENDIMDFWTFYALGCLVAFMCGTNDYYEFMVRNKAYKGQIFEDWEDIFYMIIFSLGSWLAVIMIMFSDDKE